MSLCRTSGLRTAIFDELTDGTLEVSWDSIPGRWYVLEASSELTTQWEQIGQPIQATSNSMIINVSPPEVTTKVFYRIKVME